MLLGSFILDVQPVRLGIRFFSTLWITFINFWRCTELRIHCLHMGTADCTEQYQHTLSGKTGDPQGSKKKGKQSWGKVLGQEKMVQTIYTVSYYGKREISK